MRRSVLLLFIFAIVLSAALTLPSNRRTDPLLEQQDANDSVDSSLEFSSEEEQKVIVDSQEPVESGVRRRRSGARYRNLYLLSLICPNADFSDLEKGSTLNSKIEIYDMYAICDTLPRVRFSKIN
ncbi:uncharacterized protein LOC113564343 [Drosophila erecta]|uniref:uncharacterized protein LOC113564343 n=1 Tax=Drosophila erecta TaxID=7220 RepID=UPI000F068477|nr:uncharacterized protein LOC113564343 [Drosophila erecta]